MKKVFRLQSVTFQTKHTFILFIFRKALKTLIFVTAAESLIAVVSFTWSIYESFISYQLAVNVCDIILIY